MSLPPEEATRKLLATLWQRNLPVLLNRLKHLDDTAEKAVADNLTADSRRAAGAIAHKLAGSLGMFGYPRGTELARALEEQLEGCKRLHALAIRELTTALREALAL